MTFELKIGRNGEIYTIKAVRDALNISPEDTILVFIENGLIIAKKKKSALDLLDEPEHAHVSVTPDEMEAFRKELSRFLEKKGPLFDH